MFANPGLVELIAKEKVENWRREAEADRLADVATAEGEAARARRESILIRVGKVFAAAYRAVTRPAVTPRDLPFGHAG